MRTILKHFAIDTISLYLISQSVSGIIFENGLVTMTLAGAGLMLATLVIKPILNILLLPLNLVTFGLFKWLGHAITLFLVTLVVPGFKLDNFYFPGLETYWVNLPSLAFSGILAFLVFSFLISFISSIIYWIFK